jgi:predicted transposase/invertase (TIGR01784 family)
LYYWSKLYTSQLKNTDGYKGLVPTIGINILKFILLPELPAVHNFFMITEAREKKYVLTDHLVIHFLELPKIESLEISSKIDRWLLYLKKEGKDDEMLNILIKDDDDLKLAHKKYETFTSDQKLRWLAIDREKAERDKIYHENMSKWNKAEVMAEGLNQGLNQGIEQERSMQEELRKQEKLETAKKMLAEGLDIKMISHISGLSIVEIEKLKP